MSKVKKLVGVVLESKGKLRIFKKEDELPDDKYYVKVPADQASEFQLKVVDGDIHVGPFDSADDATAVAGEMPVVNDEGTPVMNPTEQKKARENKLREQVMKRIQEAEATALSSVDTTVAAGDVSTDDASGSLVRTSVTGVVNPGEESPAPPLNSEVDAQPPAAPMLDDPAGGMNSDVPAPTPDGDLVVSDGDAAVTESDGWTGSFVTVSNKANMQIDSGMVLKADSVAITLQGGAVYNRKEHNIRKIA